MSDPDESISMAVFTRFSSMDGHGGTSHMCGLIGSSCMGGM